MASMSEDQSIRYSSCYALLVDDELILGNDCVERRWKVKNGLLFASSFFDQRQQREWLAGVAEIPAPYPPFPLPMETRTLHLTGGEGQAMPTEQSSLLIEVSARGATVTLRYHFQIFPGVPGILLRLETVTSAELSAVASVETPEPGSTDPSGIELDAPTGKGAAQGQEQDSIEHLILAAPHLRLKQVTFVDQTDHHNEILFEREWLLHPSERNLALEGNLFIFEDTLTHTGLILLKHAPLPHAQPIRYGPDLRVAAVSTIAFSGHGLSNELGEGYGSVVLSYTGGQVGMIETLHSYQRALRAYEPERDGLLLSCTWGDRSRDGRIAEAFLLEEIEVATRLGIDVYCIDDGWQQGRTSNSIIREGGVWEGFYAADKSFWEPHRTRLPRGLTPILDALQRQHIRLGLWFAPDSSDDFASWQRDAETLLHLYRIYGVHYFKIDAVEIRSKLGEQRLHSFFETLLRESRGEVVFDVDVTAGKRLGYVGLIAAGPIFVENRYTDWHNYWPHQTLRTLWKLAHYIDPVRLRMEFLNNARNTHLYADDPLAPEHYSMAYLFAITMITSPLCWCEVSQLSEEQIAQVQPLIAIWKEHRELLQHGQILPIGACPDGTAWTGFVSISADRVDGYVLLFREYNKEGRWISEQFPFLSGTYAITMLSPEGFVQVTNGYIIADLPAERSFLFAAIKRLFE